MRTTLLLALLTVACVSPAPQSSETGDGAIASPSSLPFSGPEPDLSRAQFYAHRPGVAEDLELWAQSFTVQVQTGPQAVHTHLSIVMKNPGLAQVEAAMRLPIPPGAAVTRAVLWVDDRPMEGAFVARDRARAVYQAITERRRDPALITWSGPDWIEVRVFPVEASGQRLLELEWLEPSATGDGRILYRVPVLADQGRQVKRPTALTVDGRSVTGNVPTWLALPAPAGTGGAAVAREPGNPFGYFLSPAKQAEVAPDGAQARLVLVAETSRTMSPPDRKRQRQALNGLLTALPENAEVSLLAVDWRVRSLAEAKSPSQVRAALDVLDAIPSAGALDLQNALLAAAEHARARHADHIVFLGQGTDAFKGDALAAPLQRMQEARQMLIVMGDDLASGPMVDVAALTGGQRLSWSDAGHAARLLSAIRRTQPALALDGAEPFFPLETVTGQTRWLARFVGEAPAGVVRGANRDMEALWTRAHVMGTVDRDQDRGTLHRVLTPLTAILVLETMADYARWGIPKPGEPDTGWEKVLLDAQAKPGKTRESLFGRDSTVRADAVDVLGGVVGNPVGEAYGLGGLGISGTGAGGTGRAAIGLGGFETLGKHRGRDDLHGAHALRPTVPEVVPGQLSVHGPLDNDIVRRVVRRHLNEVRYCYQQALAGVAGIEGELAVQFVISPSGQVLASMLQSSTIGNARVETCVVDAVKRWEFPKPIGGGIAVVSHHFSFGSDSAGPASVQPSVAWRNLWDESSAILRTSAPLPARVARIAAAVGAPRETRPALLAWWLVEHELGSTRQPTAAYLVIATLLEEAGMLDDAVRILSEGAPADPAIIAAELRRWNRLDDAKRVQALQARGER